MGTVPFESKLREFDFVSGHHGDYFTRITANESHAIINGFF
jgi:hypothetical protein